MTRQVICPKCGQPGNLEARAHLYVDFWWQVGHPINRTTQNVCWMSEPTDHPTHEPARFADQNYTMTTQERADWAKFQSLWDGHANERTPQGRSE